jgi:hypothetical protein
MGTRTKVSAHNTLLSVLHAPNRVQCTSNTIPHVIRIRMRTDGCASKCTCYGYMHMIHAITCKAHVKQPNTRPRTRLARGNKTMRTDKWSTLYHHPMYVNHLLCINHGCWWHWGPKWTNSVNHDQTHVHAHVHVHVRCSPIILHVIKGRACRIQGWTTGRRGTNI